MCVKISRVTRAQDSLLFSSNYISTAVLRGAKSRYNVKMSQS